MKRTATIWKMQLVLFATALIAPSCTDHEEISSDREEGIAKTITISVAIPAGTNPQTRSIDVQQENAINTLDLLAFHVDNTGEYFDYYSEGKKPSTNADDGLSKQTFSVNIKTKTTQQRLVLIANARPEVKELIASRDWKNAEKTAMLRNLEMTVDTCHWNVISADDYKALPMWGESGIVILTASTDELKQAIPLLRMVAKIDVRLSGAAVDKFKLKSVRLYNTRTRGFIVPDADVLMEETREGERYLRVTAPTVPNDDTKVLGPMIYTDFSPPGIEDVAMEGAIYAFESEDPVGIDRKYATALVVGGIFDTDTEETYYRVDFLAEDNKTYLDILRNHQYSVNISDVKARGYNDPDDAWNGASENLLVTVFTWDQDGMTNIVFNNQFYLSVSQESFAFSRDSLKTNLYSENRNVLFIKTNYTSVSDVSGWHIDKENIVDDSGKQISWLTVSEHHGDPDVDGETILYLDENTTGAERKAIFYVSAGRFRYPITVTQNTQERPEIKIFYGNEITADFGGEEIDQLIFAPNVGGTIQGQDITVQWKPANADLLPFCAPLGTLPFFTTNDNINVIRPENESNGVVTFGILSTMTISSSEVGPGRPFYKRAAHFTFSTSNDISTMTKTLTMYLIYPDVSIVEAVVENFNMTVYCPVGRTTTVRVRSNAKWKISGIEDAGGILTNENSIKSQSGGDINVDTEKSLDIAVSAGANLNAAALITFNVLNPSTHKSYTGGDHHPRTLIVRPTTN